MILTAVASLGSGVLVGYAIGRIIKKNREKRYDKDIISSLNDMKWSDFIVGIANEKIRRN